MTHRPGECIMPSRTRRPRLRTIADFWARIAPPDSAGCRLWQGRVTPEGYGQLGWGGREWYAHKLVYDLLVGAVPLGLVLDHACHTTDLLCPGGPTCPHRRCCEVTHLESVTIGENVRRSRLVQTECKHGHSFLDPDNIYIRPDTGVRTCATCRAIRNAARYRRPT